MTTNPSDQPRPDDRGGATPPPPPAPSGYEAQVPPGSAPPPAGHGAPPPSYGQGAPSYGPPSYGQAPPAHGQTGSAGQPPYGGWGGQGGQGGGYGGPPPGYPSRSAAPLSDVDQRMWATLAHVGGIVLGFVAPLVVWLVFKERGRFVDEQGKEALNFQITIAIAYVVAGMLSVIGIGIVLVPVVWLVSVILAIMAAVATNRGEAYRYPMTIRLIR